jgi:two-component system chemotaxis response regulator CheY
MNGKKILIVDDDAVIVSALSMKLKSAGYQVVSAMDGSGAIAATRKENPDLILLDVNFPTDVGVVWDGFKIIAWLQRVDESKQIPVIVISGGDEAKYKERSLEAGAIAFLQKPIDNDRMLGLIGKALSAEPARSAKV